MSGIYIKGRKPPNSCDDCWVSDCPNDEHIDGYRMMGRPTYCPLITVPSHGRLIDADEVEQDAQMRMLICHKNDNQFQKPYEVMRAIALAPTIIPSDHADKGGRENE